MEGLRGIHLPRKRQWKLALYHYTRNCFFQKKKKFKKRSKIQWKKRASDIQYKSESERITKSVFL